MSTRVVLICESTSVFIAPIRKLYSLVTARSGKLGIDAVNAHHAELVVLDAVSLGTNGERISRAVRDEFPQLGMIHIHPGPRDQAASKADVLLFAPVTIKSVLSTIRHLASKQQPEIVQCGPFMLNVDRRVIRAYGRETALTPKIAALAEVFFRHPGEVLERKWLMQQVWQTDYTGDTRTLSVHIRYLRELLEADPSLPVHIRTVRGSGYVFDCASKNKKPPR